MTCRTEFSNKVNGRFCSTSHPTELQQANAQIEFLPVNTISLIQPQDHVIIGWTFAKVLLTTALGFCWYWKKSSDDGNNLDEKFAGKAIAKGLRLGREAKLFFGLRYWYWKNAEIPKKKKNALSEYEEIF